MIPLTILFAAALLCLAAVFCVVFHHKAETRHAVVDLYDSLQDSRLPKISVCQDKLRLRFLLDSGSGANVISPAYLQHLDYEKLDIKVPSVGIDGKEQECGAVRMRLEIKGLVFTTDFLVRDIPSSTECHGILGTRFMKDFGYVLDFHDQTAYFKNGVTRTGRKQKGGGQ